VCQWETERIKETFLRVKRGGKREGEKQIERERGRERERKKGGRGRKGNRVRDMNGR
jgi:hypothetical protein